MTTENDNSSQPAVRATEVASVGLFGGLLERLRETAAVLAVTKESAHFYGADLRSLEADMADAARRLEAQASRIRRYAECVDGFGIKGEGMESHRDGHDIRRIVERLQGEVAHWKTVANYNRAGSPNTKAVGSRDSKPTKPN